MSSPGTSPFSLSVEPGPTPAPKVKRVPAVPVQQITNAPGTRSRKPPHVGVYLETEHAGNEFAPSEVFDWQNITFGMDGGDTTATIAAGLDAAKLGAGGTIGTQHLTHLLEQLSPDRRVRIAQIGGLVNNIYFQGYPQVSTAAWGKNGQSVSCLCLSEGEETLRTHADAQVFGRRMRGVPNNDWIPGIPDDVAVTALLPVFNAGGRGNRSAAAYEFIVGGESYRIHLFLEDDAPEAGYWSVAEAMRYLAFFYILRPGLAVSVTEFLIDTEPFVDIEPSAGSSDPFVRRMTAKIADISTASMSVEEAVAQLVDLGGLHYEIALRGTPAAGFFLRVFAAIAASDEGERTPARQMIAPRIYDVPREAPFTDLTGRSPGGVALANRTVEANLTIDQRAINAPIFLGGHKEYEVTLLLRPGWKPECQYRPGCQHRLDNLQLPIYGQSVFEQQAAELFWENLFFTGPFFPPEIYHPKHPDHHLVADVGRYWIFPDDHRWIKPDGTSDYERNDEDSNTNWPAELYGPLDPEDPTSLVLVRDDIGGGIDDVGKWVPRRRPFRELIGRRRSSDERQPQVLVNFTATDPYTALESLLDPDPVISGQWIPFGGKPVIDPLRAGITFVEEDLWGCPHFLQRPDEPWGMNMLKAYIGRQADMKSFGPSHFMVAINCTVRGDRRLMHRPLPAGSSFRRLRSQVVDTGFDQFRYQNRRGQSSRLNAQENDLDPAFEDRDDTPAFEGYADREAQIAAGDTVSGSLETFWIDPTYRLGDSFSGVKGLGIAFKRYPAVVRKQYVKDVGSSEHPAGFRTVLHLSDLRGAPEVGAE